MRKLLVLLRDNSLTLFLCALFLACFAGYTYAGWRLQNDTLVAHGRTAVGFWQFLGSGRFFEDVSSNWQAAILQLASLILLSSFLFQLGAPHSRDPQKRKKRARKLYPGLSGWLYRHSLSLAFFALFLASQAMHAVYGAEAYNQTRALAGEPPLSTAQFLVSAKFWSTTLATWQAEYLVIALYIVLSIFLREEGSAESKPVQASKKATGKHNE